MRADPLIVAQMVEAGADAQEAAAAVERVFAAIPAVLLKGKGVTLPGVGRLVAPRKPVFMPGTVKTHAREQRKVTLKGGIIIEKGDPYPVSGNLNGGAL